VSSSDILERPDTRESDTGSANEVFHYVKKNKIAESAVMGTMVEALCGEVFPVTKSPKPGSPVCPACKEIYQQLKKEKARHAVGPSGPRRVRAGTTKRLDPVGDGTWPRCGPEGRSVTASRGGGPLRAWRPGAPGGDARAAAAAPATGPGSSR
jgi:hypothetical protein